MQLQLRVARIGESKKEQNGRGGTRKSKVVTGCSYAFKKCKTLFDKARLEQYHSERKEKNDLLSKIYKLEASE